MNLTRWELARGRFDPWRELSSLREWMGRSLDEPTARREEAFLSPAWMPPVDVYETADAIVLKAELPGVPREDVDIQVEQNVLTIKGERRSEKEVAEEACYRTERLSGSFLRSFHLPRAVDPEKIKATMKDGVLEVRLAKAEEARPRKIAVS
jgi:HSP20 family protein